MRSPAGTPQGQHHTCLTTDNVFGIAHHPPLRTEPPSDPGWFSSDFRQLQAWTYPLCDVELLVLAHADEPSQPDAAAADSNRDEAGHSTDAPETAEIEPVNTTGDQDLAA